MPRALTPKDGFFPFHVTARSNNKDWFSIPIESCWRIFQQHLVEFSNRYHVEIHSFVLMSNHFHLLVTTPDKNLGQAMRYLMTEVSRDIARAAGRINHVFGGRYKWSWLVTEQSIAYVYKYIFRNPVRAGITARVELYPFSSLNMTSNSAGGIPICERLDWDFMPKDFTTRLNWLNSPSVKEELLIKQALRRAKFTFSCDKKVRLGVSRLAANYLTYDMRRRV
jgi:REP element-mobilizing transposase RayT